MTTPTGTPDRPALDFAVIRQQCPKAFDALVAWTLQAKFRQPDLHRQYVQFGHVRCYIPAHPRDLYDFFDGQGVYVSVDVDTNYNPLGFSATLATNGKQVQQGCGYYPTRAEAETAAFGAAFDRLELMINQKGGL